MFGNPVYLYAAASAPGDTINIAFGNAAGLPTLQTGQWYAIVLLAEVLGLEAASADAFRQVRLKPPNPKLGMLPGPS